MNDPQAWLDANDAYLAAAVAWVRLRLRYVAQTEKPGTALAIIPEENQEAGKQGWSLLGKWSRQNKPAERSTSDGPHLVSEADIQAAKEAMDQAREMDPPSALCHLCESFGLSDFEREILLLCIAVELDTRIGMLCAQAQADPARIYPTFALAFSLFETPAWDALSPGRPLRYWHLLDIHQQAATPLTAAALHADERIVSYIKGLNFTDPRIAMLLLPFDEVLEGTGLPPSQTEVAEDIVSILDSGEGQHPWVIQLVGADPLSKQTVALHAATYLGLGLSRMPVNLLPRRAEDIEVLPRLWQKESLLLPVALFLDAHEVDDAQPGESQSKPPLNQFLTRCQSLVFLSVRDVLPGLGHRSAVIEVNKPTPLEQRDAWVEAMAGEEGTLADLLADQFNFNEATIRRITATATSGMRPEESLEQAIWRICLGHDRPQMDLLAQRLDAKATWDDIVLPEKEGQLLRRIADQVCRRTRVYDDWGFRERMNRGLGISVLFEGESGTGKTMAAEVLANALNLNLYRIDLSAVVSKYIGETEKNLRRVFDRAEAGGILLFFDEADALFGKRSEVKDSHDRYANIEVNYLLQRMEAFRGLAVLATNRKSALDTAFTRRLRFILKFPFPSVAQRKQIWEKVFPKKTPLDDLDFNHLARLNLPGGNIQNIALNAAFAAARNDSKVTMDLVLAAAYDEYQKTERPINDALFRYKASSGAVA